MDKENNQMIYISNWHTSYSELLSKVFKKFIIFRKWDFDQRDFPKILDIYPCSR